MFRREPYEVLLNEQDVIDALILYVAQRENIDPERVRVEVRYEEGRGFSAHAIVD